MFKSSVLLLAFAFVLASTALEKSALAQVVDFDGDNREDLIQFHSGKFNILDPRGLEIERSCGSASDLPIAGNFLSNGSAKLGTWNPSFGVFTLCSNSGSAGFRFDQGSPGDLPVVGDYNGDGLADYALFRRSDQTWIIGLNSGGLAQPVLQVVTQGGLGPHALPAAADYDGDGITDLALVVPQDGALRWQLKLSSGGLPEFFLGVLGDVPVPADYNGDGRAEPAVFRPETGVWDSGSFSRQFGLPGDMPVALDFDGDGKSDLAVYRPTSNRWYLSLQANPGVIQETGFGTKGSEALSGSILNLLSRRTALDFNGDHLSDFAVVRSTTTGKLLFLFESPGSLRPPREKLELGVSGDFALALDFDGDGVSDPGVVHRGIAALEWALVQSSQQAGGRVELRVNYGLPGDTPFPGDYDGDGRADLCVLREQNGFLTWIPFPSGKDSLTPVAWGLKSDTPLSADMDGDGRSDFIVVRELNGELVWFMRMAGGSEVQNKRFGSKGDEPWAMDFDGDGKAEIAVVRDVNGAKTAYFESGEVRAFGLTGDQTHFAQFSGTRANNSVVWRLIGDQGVFFVQNGVFGAGGRPFGVKGDRVLKPSGVTLTAGSTATSFMTSTLKCASQSDISRQERGFNWKPVSDSDQKLAILFGASLKQKIKTVALVAPSSSGDQILETLRFVGNKGGSQPTFRASKPGSGYPAGTILVRQDTNGRNACILVSNPGKAVP